jgi:Predicted membrane protein
MTAKPPGRCETPNQQHTTAIRKDRAKGTPEPTYQGKEHAGPTGKRAKSKTPETGMTHKTVAKPSPGDKGEGEGAANKGQGNDDNTVPAGRSAETRMRAERAGNREDAEREAQNTEAELDTTNMPPEQAEELAAEVAAATTRTRRSPTAEDMNAKAPTTARRKAEREGAAGADYVDGGINGRAPGKTDSETRLHVTGPKAARLDQ